MSDPTCIQCEYVNYIPAVTRGVSKIILEIPSEMAKDFLLTFDTPSPSKKIILTLANVPPEQLTISEAAHKSADLKHALEESVKHEKQRKSWSELSRAQQAGIACNEKGFWQFLNEMYRAADYQSADAAASVVREICNCDSRRELDTNESAGRDWDTLYENYMLWLRQPAA
jgi:hypothetical protein